MVAHSTRPPVRRVTRGDCTPTRAAFEYVALSNAMPAIERFDFRDLSVRSMIAPLITRPIGHRGTRANMNLLITGANGFVGKALTTRLLNEPAPLVPGWGPLGRLTLLDLAFDGQQKP